MKNRHEIPYLLWVAKSLYSIEQVPMCRSVTILILSLNSDKPKISGETPGGRGRTTDANHGSCHSGRERSLIDETTTRPTVRELRQSSF